VDRVAKTCLNEFTNPDDLIAEAARPGGGKTGGEELQEPIPASQTIAKQRAGGQIVS